MLPAVSMPANAQTQSGPQTAVPAPADASQDSMPDIGLDWPDLEEKEPLPAPSSETPGALPSAPASTPAPTQAAQQADGTAPNESAAMLEAIDPAAPLRYGFMFDGLGDAADETLMDRFNALSALRAGERQPANIAQIRRRGRADASLLDELLRVRGYYDSRTGLDFRPGGQPGQIEVLLVANPGRIYQLDQVNLDGLAMDDPREAALRAQFGVKVGDPADTDRIKAATDALREGLLNDGYPFAKVREPVLVINHEERTAVVNLTANPGDFRRIGRIIVNSDAPFDARHVAVISRFSPGDPFRQSDITDLDRALIATGLISQARIEPKPGARDDTVDLDLTLHPAPHHTIAGEIGYGTGEGARIEASWQNRNFFRPEGAVTFRGVLGQQEQSVAAVLRRANFGARDRILNGQISAANVNQPAYQARTVGVSASLERQTNLIFQKAWTWSLGGEFLVSDERDLYGADLVPRRRTYVIAAMPTSLNYDGSDDLLDPRRGFRLGGRLSPEVSLQGGAFGYVRAQVDGSGYVHASDRLTLAGRVRLGTIVGASRDRIAPTRRFYAGGGASVRGYSYQAIGPRDANNTPLGGRSLGEVSLEARFRFGSADQFGLVPFIDAGTISADPLPSIREGRVGAGLGLRYYSNFGPIRIDLGTPLNPQPGDTRIAVAVSLGQAF